MQGYEKRSIASIPLLHIGITFIAVLSSMPARTVVLLATAIAMQSLLSCLRVRSIDKGCTAVPAPPQQHLTYHLTAAALAFLFAEGKPSDGRTDRISREVRLCDIHPCRLGRGGDIAFALPSFLPLHRQAQEGRSRLAGAFPSRDPHQLAIQITNAL